MTCMYRFFVPVKSHSLRTCTSWIIRWQDENDDRSRAIYLLQRMASFHFVSTMALLGRRPAIYRILKFLYEWQKQQFFGGNRSLASSTNLLLSCFLERRYSCPSPVSAVLMDCSCVSKNVFLAAVSCIQPTCACSYLQCHGCRGVLTGSCSLSLLVLAVYLSVTSLSLPNQSFCCYVHVARSMAAAMTPMPLLCSLLWYLPVWWLDEIEWRERVRQEGVREEKRTLGKRWLGKNSMENKFGLYGLDPTYVWTLACIVYGERCA